jgi:hypothetical protein
MADERRTSNIPRRTSNIEVDVNALSPRLVKTKLAAGVKLAAARNRGICELGCGRAYLACFFSNGRPVFVFSETS